MKMLSRKYMILVVMLTLVACPAFARRRKKRKDPIIGSWNALLFQQLNGVDGQEELENGVGIPLTGVITFNPCGTLVADGLAPLFFTDSVAPSGFDTIIAVGTWKRIARKLYLIETSLVLKGFAVGALDNHLGQPLRIKSRGIVSLDPCARKAGIVNVVSQVFSYDDTCLERPLDFFVPVLNGELCKLPRPKKVVKAQSK